MVIAKWIWCFNCIDIGISEFNGRLNLDDELSGTRLQRDGQRKGIRLFHNHNSDSRTFLTIITYAFDPIYAHVHMKHNSMI